MIPAKLRPPRDKFDLAAVAALNGADADTLRPLLPSCSNGCKMPTGRLPARWPSCCARTSRRSTANWPPSCAATTKSGYKPCLPACATTDAAARAFLNRRAAPDQVPEKQP